MPPGSQCCAFLDLIKCYHGLGRVDDAAEAAIMLVQVAESMAPGNCLQGDLEATHRWIYETLWEFENLRIFLDPEVVASGSPSIAELSSDERTDMHQIMTKAKERQMVLERRDQVYQEAKELLDRWRPIFESLGGGQQID